MYAVSGRNPARDYSGTFNQSGGTNTTPNLIVGDCVSGATGIGTYNLTGGILITSFISPGSSNATAAFNFGGGTLQASGSFTTTLPMTLTGSGGNATVDTAGYTATFAAPFPGPAD